MIPPKKFQKFPLRIRRLALAGVSSLVAILVCIVSLVGCAPTTPNAGVLDKAKALRGESKYKEAVVLYQQALQSDNKNVEIYAGLSVCEQYLDNYKLALEYSDLGLKVDPKDTFLLALRGDALANLDKKREAIKAYTAAIDLNPDYDYAYECRGWVYETLNETDNAVADYKKATESDEADAQVFDRLGTIYLARGQVKEAIESFDRGAAMANDDPANAAECLQSRAMAYLQLNLPEEALKDAEEACSLDNDATKLTARALAKQCLGRKSAAVEDLNLAYANDKEGMDKNYGSISLIWLALLEQEAHNTKAAAEHIQELDKTCDKSKWPRPLVDYLNGKMPADKLLQVTKNPDQLTELKTYLAMDQTAKGQPDKAVENLQWVVAHGNKEYMEWPMARAELARLKAAMPAPVSK